MFVWTIMFCYSIVFYHVNCTRRKCDICVGRIHKAVKFCKVCKAVYCEDHIRDHYMAPGLRKHTVVDATDDHGHVEIERTSTQVEGFILSQLDS